MKAFRFPLQPIRVIRERKENEAQKLYAAALRSYENASHQLQKASDELAAGWSALCQETSQGARVGALLRTRAWCNVLESRQKECAQALHDARQALDSASRELMIARRDREALDKYHDKSRRAYDRATQRAEQKDMDEIALRTPAFTLRVSHHNPQEN